MGRKFTSVKTAMTRRDYLQCLGLIAGASVLPGMIFPGNIFAEDTQPTPTESEAAAMEKIARDAMEKHEVPGLSVAIARRGQMVYQQGFGLADKLNGERVKVGSLFRIASLSKAITSAAIFTLIEAKRLGVDDLVFGEKGVLKFDYGKDYPSVINKITVHHLLTHTCGGWENNGSDPMFLRVGLSQAEIITKTLRDHPLEHEPGEHYAYSNFGYCVLGRVIEKIAGWPYARYAQEAVLEKCGVTGMRLAGNTLAERAANEVVYYGHEGSGTNPYGMNVTRMDSHGGWIATPSDLVRFMTHVDGFKTTPNILSVDSIKTMTTGTSANPHYACGWMINNIPNWWHNGSLPGTATIMVRTARGLCWAAFVNTRVNNGLNLDEMMWRMVKEVPAWHA